MQMLFPFLEFSLSPEYDLADNDFLPRDAASNASAVLGVVILSVRPSVLSHACFVTK